MRVSNLATVVALAGGSANLQRAEELLRDALREEELPLSERTVLHHNLGAIMREAAEATRDRDLLRDAILNLRLADAAAAEDGGLPEARRSLALALHARWQLDRQSGPLDESHDLLESALANSPAGSPLRPLILSDLGGSLIARAAHRVGAARPAPGAGEESGAQMPSLGPDPRVAALAREDLERAVDLLAAALDEPAAGAATRALSATQYGEALASLGWLTGRPGLVEESLPPQRRPCGPSTRPARTGSCPPSSLPAPLFARSIPRQGTGVRPRTCTDESPGTRHPVAGRRRPCPAAAGQRTRPHPRSGGP